MNNMSFNNSGQIQMMMQQYQRMQEKQAREKERLLRDLNKNYNKDKIRQSVIQPLKIEKDDKELAEIKKKGKIADIDRRNKRKGYWGTRTNNPYKNIIKKENHSHLSEIKKMTNTKT